MALAKFQRNAYYSNWIHDWSEDTYYSLFRGYIVQLVQLTILSTSQLSFNLLWKIHIIKFSVILSV